MKTVVFLIFVIGAIWTICHFQTGPLLSTIIVLTAVAYGFVTLMAMNGFSRKRGGDP